ncbi:MAG: hypothetical protein Q4G25_02950 [Paracoccus sp. (in: a-proteobacteria)]|nr:hypothetical protein [Paracoccus sp. (in: a-proteobacteria)]
MDWPVPVILGLRADQRPRRALRIATAPAVLSGFIDIYQINSTIFRRVRPEQGRGKGENG